MLNSGTMGTVKSEPAYLVFRSKFVTDFDWVLKAMGKRQAIGSMGGHGFEGQNLIIGFGWPDIIFKMGMGRQNLSKYYQTIRSGGNVSTGHGSDY